MFNRAVNSYKCYTYLPMFLGVIVYSAIFLFLILNGRLEILSLDNNLLDLTDYQFFSYRYIIVQRLILIISFFVILFLFSYYFASVLYSFFLGIYYMFISVDFVIKYGINGVVLVVVLFVPVFFFYFSSVCLIGKWFYGYNDTLNFLHKRFNNFNFFVKIAFIVLMLLAGLIFEIFFQKNFLKFLPIYCS